MKFFYEYLSFFLLNVNSSCCSCALNMLLSVICIVLVIAAIVGAAVYFGILDKDKDAEGNLKDIGNTIQNTGKEFLEKIKPN